MTVDRRPGRTVVANTPVRVADVGGWTDTWFGSPGRVCHLAVGPGVRVWATFVDRAELLGGHGGLPVLIDAPDVAAAYRCGPDADGGWVSPEPSRHPLLEHAVGSVMERVELPAELGIELEIRSAVPQGASLGTSAAVVVAVLGALDLLCRGEVRSPAELAVAAHQVETGRAGREAGVQDHWAAAMGGAGLLSIGPYPEARHQAVALSEATTGALAERLVTVVFGPHDSSAVHAEVIDAVVGCGGAHHDRVRAAFRRLAGLADDAAAALRSGDIDGWAAVLTEATEAQRSLHPALIGPAHQAAVDTARSAGAAGWKVNGAGGDRGSMTMVAADADRAATLAAALDRRPDGWQILDLAPAPRIQVDLIRP